MMKTWYQNDSFTYPVPSQPYNTPPSKSTCGSMGASFLGVRGSSCAHCHLHARELQKDISAATTVWHGGILSILSCLPKTLLEVMVPTIPPFPLPRCQQTAPFHSYEKFSSPTESKLFIMERFPIPVKTASGCTLLSVSEWKRWTVGLKPAGNFLKLLYERANSSSLCHSCISFRFRMQSKVTDVAAVLSEIDKKKETKTANEIQ